MTMEKERQEFTSWQFDRIIQLEQELAELRAWKARAMPLLERYVERCIDKEIDFALWVNDDSVYKLSTHRAILTELIKGDK